MSGCSIPREKKNKRARPVKFLISTHTNAASPSPLSPSWTPRCTRIIFCERQRGSTTKSSIFLGVDDAMRLLFEGAFQIFPTPPAYPPAYPLRTTVITSQCALSLGTIACSCTHAVSKICFTFSNDFAYRGGAVRCVGAVHGLQ